MIWIAPSEKDADNAVLEKRPRDATATRPEVEKVVASSRRCSHLNELAAYHADCSLGLPTDEGSGAMRNRPEVMLIGASLKLQMQSVSGGTTQEDVSLDKLLTHDFLVPPLSVQLRIAGILSAYDELMENSQRRIRLLEAMARALYRAWFVHFRFPGHQDVRFVGTQFGRVPEGWVLAFADHVDFKEGPGLRNWQYRKEGLPLLNIRTLVDNDIDLSKVRFLDPKEVEENYQHFLLREHDHVVSGSETIGRIVTIRAEHLPLMLNTGIIRMRLQGKRMGCWLLKHFMLSDYFQDQAKSFATGADQANFGPIHLKQMKIIALDERTAAEYERLVVPMELAIMSLARKIQNLRRTRDLLLPRLLPGQVSLKEN